MAKKNILDNSLEYWHREVDGGSFTALGYGLNIEVDGELELSSQLLEGDFGSIGVIWVLRFLNSSYQTIAESTHTSGDIVDTPVGAKYLSLYLVRGDFQVMNITDIKTINPEILEEVKPEPPVSNEKIKGRKIDYIFSQRVVESEDFDMIYRKTDRQVRKNIKINKDTNE